MAGNGTFAHVWCILLYSFHTWLWNLLKRSSTKKYNRLPNPELSLAFIQSMLYSTTTIKSFYQALAFASCSYREHKPRLHKGPHRFCPKTTVPWIHSSVSFVCVSVPPNNCAGTPAYNGCIEQPFVPNFSRGNVAPSSPSVGPSWVMPDWPKHLLKGSKGRQNSLVSWQPESQQPEW